MDWAIARQALAGNTLEGRGGVWESLRICALSKRRGPITEANVHGTEVPSIGFGPTDDSVSNRAVLGLNGHWRLG